MKKRTARNSVVAATVLAAGLAMGVAPRAEAVSASATGGTVTNYPQGDKQWRAFVFTNYPVNEIPTMTASNAPSGVASASSEQSSSYPAWNAMDKNGGTRWNSSGAMPQWLQYQFASGKVINGYEFSAFNATQNPSNFTLQASNDGSTWTTLDTQTGKSAVTQYYLFSNTVSYTYYRLNVTAVGGGGGTSISLWEFMLYSTPALAVTDGGDVEYLVVAAGGAGGTTYDTGGGGAGGMLTGSVTLAAGTYPVFVGFDSGRDSLFSTLRAIVGGQGSSASPGTGAAGGSGGGSVRGPNSTPPGYAGGAGTFGQGNKGGGSGLWQGGGGGGAGGPGVDAINATGYICAGGPGLTNSISGSPVPYAAGGKGYSRSASDTTSGKGTPGGPNTGNGGNGGANGLAGGNGGSGIVIVRYVISAQLPIISNLAATNVTAAAADLLGYLSSTGAAPASVSVYWGASDGGTNAGNWAHAVDLGPRDVGTNNCPITGLVPQSTYYYRCLATNSFGAAWAPATASFTTAQPNGPIYRFW